MAGNDSGQSGRIGQRQENVNHGVPFVTNDTYPQAPWDGMLVYNETISQFQIWSSAEDGWLDPYLGQFGNQTYVGPVAPAVGMKPGDLWIKTPENLLHIWTSTQWLEYSDPRILEKTQTFVAPNASPPTAKAVGDLWIVTDMGNLTRRWSGSQWLTYKPGAENLTGTLPNAVLVGTQVQLDAAKAITDSANAGTTAASALSQAEQAITKGNTAIQLATQSSADAAAAILAAGTATSTANDASADAAAAIEKANAAPEVTTSNTAPTSPKIDDLWFVPVAGNKMFTWNGSQWVAVTGSTAPNSITGLELTDFAVTVKKLQTSRHMIY